MFYYLTGEILLIALICFIRYTTLYHSQPVKRAARKLKLPSYEIGSIIKKLRNTTTQPKHLLHYSNFLKESKQLVGQPPVSPKIPAVLDSARAGTNTFYQYMYIDDSMYSEISKLSKNITDNLSNLSVRIKTYANDSKEFVDNSLNRIKEHIIENNISEYFKKTGINIQWPESSNKEDWDLLLNGNPIQLKYMENTNKLIEHFDRQPYIPVAVPSDENNTTEKIILEVNPSESIDHLFNHLKTSHEKSAISNNSLFQTNLTDNFEEGTGMIAKSAAFDFPWITAAFSGFREAKLLVKNSTDILSSLKNAGLDIAGTAIGGGVGCTIGATIGSLLFPGIGTIAGVALGALSGNILGRTITNDIKQEPLKKALKKLKKSTMELKKQEIEIEKKYKDKFHQDKERAQQHMNQTAMETKNNIDKEIKNLRQWIVDRKKLSNNIRNNLLEHIPDTISSIIKTTRLSWTEYFWPSQKTIIYKRKIRNIKKSIEEQLHNQTITDRVHLLQKLSESGLCYQQVFFEIKRAEEEKRSHENNIMQKITRKHDILLRQRFEHMELLATKASEYFKQIRMKLSPHIKRIERYQNLVKRESKKLDMNQTVNKKTANTFEVSDNLATVIGSKTITKQKAIKNFWNYVKQKKLQDSNNTQNIKLDNRLKKLFGNKEQVTMLEITKTINKNLHNKLIS